MNTFKRIIGILLISLCLGGLVVATCVAYGTKDALLVFGVPSVIACVMVIGVYLLLNDV